MPVGPHTRSKSQADALSPTYFRFAGPSDVGGGKASLVLAVTVWPYDSQVIGVVVCAGALVADPSGLRASTSYQ
jgi:hypothetical protein